MREILPSPRGRKRGGVVTPGRGAMPRSERRRGLPRERGNPGLGRRGARHPIAGGLPTPLLHLGPGPRPRSRGGRLDGLRGGGPQLLGQLARECPPRQGADFPLGMMSQAWAPPQGQEEQPLPEACF